MADGGRSVSGNVNTGLVDGDDVDINDCFDAIEMAGERFRNEGYMEGLDAGRSVGYQEGVTIGKKQGWKIGSELGFYHGFASSWRKLAAQYPDSKQRVIKALDSLVMMIDEFPLSDPTTQSLQDQLEQIRGKFKQISSLLNLQTEFGGGEREGTPAKLSF
ncbi:protein LTO1 homolog [Liolophura sinensis]|uniref:protein LTO1 homolog n=1 Tax=Liolophura sinensis TaxID=3198878 RepID=UPI0031587E72